MKTPFTSNWMSETLMIFRCSMLVIYDDDDDRHELNEKNFIQ